MRKPLFCIWNNESIQLRENKRISAIQNLNLSQEKIIPVFEEATQTVANCLNISVSCLGLLLETEYQIKSVYGLSNLGLMNTIAKTRKISRDDAFATHVIDSESYLVMENTLNDSFFSRAILTQHYGIVSYLGVPLTLFNGVCIGCLEVMDTTARKFTTQEINFMVITARWCMAEYERNLLTTSNNNVAQYLNNAQHINQSSLTKKVANISPISSVIPQNNNNDQEKYIKLLSYQLLNKLTQKLSIPLTSVIGMSSVLKQEIYGKLNSKQLEYLQIIHDSGQEMVTLVNEINKLATFNAEVNLEYVPVDLENLGKQVLKSLETIAHSRDHTLILSIEPGQKVWKLDREKVKKTLYYLLITIIESSRTGSEIQVHISKKKEYLKINCRVTHPWLGEGISSEKISLYQEVLNNYYNLSLDNKLNKKTSKQNTYEYDLICLLFSGYLAHLQAGDISLQGSSESGYRFIISIPIQ
ncbi:GAF domain-containing sensor histidine kinase [Geminocystis herdmanii]|uniref:GAF domain-containing sensor histidine kinase n=1 Tax=Geminocystis herdmanii TaxID=669359 RepID=UPI0003488825|nr:GAF domain-containing protein [Geminocystis herdmanii]